MKRKIFLLTLLSLLLPMMANAYDAKIDGIYYNFISENAAEVTSGDDIYSGAVTIPESVIYNGTTYSVTSIGDNAFSSCYLTSITIPNSVISIGEYAFAEGFDGSALISISIPNSVTTIGEGAFIGCYLTDVTIGNNVTKIEKNTFYNCNRLKSITIGNSVTSIGEYAFCFCSSLTSVTIPENVTSIGNLAFAYCSGLTSSVTISNSVTSIGDYAFEFCSGLTSITIGNSVTSIGYGAFMDCIGLTSITIPNSVITVGDKAFSDCISLTSFAIPENVSSIGNSTFSGCSGLTSVTIPNSVTSIGDGAFQGCFGLTSVTIPQSVTYIDANAFSNCYFIYDSFVNNSTLTDDNYWGATLCDEETNDGLLINDETVVKCRPWATSATIPNSVTSIGSYAFSGCSGLTSITIPNSVTSIGNYAFSGCSGLTSVTIPNSVTSIGDRVFASCSGLTSITIPNSVTSIGNNTFAYCSGLTSITIPNSVTSIGNHAFEYCSGLTSITIPNSVTTIRWGTFSGCSGLTSVTIPNNVTNIGDFAFSSCKNLTSVTIPNSVTSIGKYAFQGCGLTSVRSFIEEPYACYAFEENTHKIYNTATLYVPVGTIEAYQATDGWKNFKNIEEESGSSIVLSVIDENDADVTNIVNIVWYNAEGKKIGTGNKLNGIADSTEVYYSVLLDETLGRIYREVKMQKVMAGEEDITITCQLEKIGRVMLEGRVSAADIDKTILVVNVRQMLNGKWEQTYMTQTDEQGVFKVEAYDDETDITISGDGYLDATLHRERFGESGNVGTIPLNLISGFSIAANITMQRAVATGEAEEVTTWSEGLNNIEFTLTNTSKGSAITDFTVQNGNVIIKTGADLDDGISLTAKSKQGIFADATTSFVIADGANAFDLQLTELGGIDATCTSSSNGVTVGYLYDSNGLLTAKGTYTGETLSLRHLPTGTYTLITMGSSMLLHNMTHLADIVSVGLSEGTDYVATNVEIIDGTLAAVAVNDVPRLDDTRFYYTSNETYFNVNKPSVTAGNYLTLQAHVDFKAEHTDKTDGVTLTIDLPEGCQMVENSVIANRQAVAHTVNGSRVTIPLTKEQYESQVRFCIIPTLNQSYTITAMASFDIDGQIVQPIGSAQFEVKGLSLSAPEKVASTKVTINGTAKGLSDVSIYDNDVLIGKTTSKADGSWTAECELFKPYSHSFHDIYARITTENGMELTSEVQQVEYDKNGNVPEKVTMTFYNGWMKKNINVEFNLLEGTTTPSSYPFYHGTDFTFLADFTHNDSTEIKNVNIKVLNSDGTVRTLPATFDGKQNKWVATTKYESSNRLPQNVKVEYVAQEGISDNYEIRNDQAENIVNIAQGLYNYNEVNASYELIEDKENGFIANYYLNGIDSPMKICFELLDYENSLSMMDESQFAFYNLDDGLFCFRTEYDANSIILYSIDTAEEIAAKIILESSDNNTYTNKRRIAQFVFGAFWLGDKILTAADLSKYWNVRGELDNIANQIQIYFRRLDNWDRTIDLAIYEKCPNNDYKLAQYQRVMATEEQYQIKRKKEEFRKKFEDYLYKYRDAINRAIGKDCVMSGIGKIVGKGLDALSTKVSKIPNVQKWFDNNTSGCNSPEITADFLDQSSGIAANIPLGTVSDSPNTINPLWFDFESYPDMINKWSSEQYNAINDEYISLLNKIKRANIKCPDEDEDKENENEDFNNKSTTPNIDPSGYVYEAVMSNRLEGVTVTCYQKVIGEDMYGDITEEAVVWNAEDYSQQNPLKTDETGFYRWDVPQGMWQVKYEKEGYETTYSDWLPVPPPQLDVNISMKQTTPPTVKQMLGYESGITIELSKYMLPGTMTTENITVTHNGKDVKGTIELLNAEKAPLDGDMYVSKVKFVPNNRFIASDIVVVTVHKEVESYCGVKMTADHVETVTIESEIEEIVIENPVKVPYNGTKIITVEVLPADASAGKTLNVKTSSPMILGVELEQVVIDNEGKAEITVNGELPGTAALMFSVVGTDKETQTIVNVEKIKSVATPTASIASGSIVEKDTQVELFCATEGATIYYTLDGSCPCISSEARKIYDGTPITIEKNIVIKAMAAAPDMGESEVATFVYIVTNGDLNVDGKVDIADGVVVLNTMAVGRYEEFADVNHDGKVDIADFVTVLNIMAQLSDQQKLVTAIVLSETSIFLQPNEMKILTATVLPENADNKEVAWESNDNSIAIVDQTGKVIARQTGSCIITCSATDGSGIKADCAVIVSNPDTPDTHEYVDLGLPSGTLWATCNVGANAPEEYGDYFAWGETIGYNSGKTNFKWSTYKYCQGSNKTLTKYCLNSGHGTVDNKTVLEPEDDAATANWGSAWQMLSIDQFKELINRNYTTTEWTSLNNKNGWKITSKNNGKSIFPTRCRLSQRRGS